jgi:hypothetical protein
MLIDEIVATFTWLDYLLSILTFCGLAFSIAFFEWFDDKLITEWLYFLFVFTACCFELLVAHLYYPGFFNTVVSMTVVKLFSFPIAFRNCDYLFPWKDE